METLPQTPPDAYMGQAEHDAEMEQLAERKKQTTAKAERLSKEVERLVEQMRIKDVQIAKATTEKLAVEERYRDAQLEQMQTLKASVSSDPRAAAALPNPIDLPIRGLARALDCGPRFEAELRAFVVKKQADERQRLAREAAKAQANEKGFEAKVLRKVRDAIYFKGVNFREIFRMIDEDKSGDLSVKEFRDGLVKCGAVLDDNEFNVLLQLVDNNNDGHIQYLEFAETMKVPDVDHSHLTVASPYASVSAADALDEQPSKKWLARNGGSSPVADDGGPVMGARRIAHTHNVKSIHGLNMLPKSDIVRRYAARRPRCEIIAALPACVPVCLYYCLAPLQN